LPRERQSEHSEFFGRALFKEQEGPFPSVCRTVTISGRAEEVDSLGPYLICVFDLRQRDRLVLAASYLNVT